MVGDIPRGWNVDEAGIAYDAWCIAKYGVDRFRYPYPVMFMNYGGGGQSSLYTYMTAILFKFLIFTFCREDTGGYNVNDGHVFGNLVL